MSQFDQKLEWVKPLMRRLLANAGHWTERPLMLEEHELGELLGLFLEGLAEVDIGTPALDECLRQVADECRRAD